MAEIVYADLDWQPTDPSGPEFGPRYVAFTQTWCCWVELDKATGEWLWGVSTYGDNAKPTLEKAKAAVLGQVMI
jgi:hypothetical protein